MTQLVTDWNVAMNARDMKWMEAHGISSDSMLGITPALYKLVFDSGRDRLRQQVEDQANTKLNPDGTLTAAFKLRYQRGDRTAGATMKMIVDTTEGVQRIKAVRPESPDDLADALYRLHYRVPDNGLRLEPIGSEPLPDYVWETLNEAPIKFATGHDALTFPDEYKTSKVTVQPHPFYDDQQIIVVNPDRSKGDFKEFFVYARDGKQWKLWLTPWSLHKDNVAAHPVAFIADPDDPTQVLRYYSVYDLEDPENYHWKTFRESVKPVF